MIACLSIFKQEYHCPGIPAKKRSERIKKYFDIIIVNELSRLRLP